MKFFLVEEICHLYFMSIYYTNDVYIEQIIC